MKTFIPVIKIRMVTCQSAKNAKVTSETTVFPPCSFKYKFQFCFSLSARINVRKLFVTIHTYSEMSPAVNKN